MMLTSTQIGELAAQFFIAGAGTLSFAVLFGCPRKSLPFCGLVGAVGWFVYELAVMLGADSAAASLLAVIPLTLLTRVFAIVLKMPVTVFLLSGIFPLVPGAGIYYTAYYFIQGNNALALSNGISTFKVAIKQCISERMSQKTNDSSNNWSKHCGKKCQHCGTRLHGCIRDNSQRNLHFCQNNEQCGSDTGCYNFFDSKFFHNKFLLCFSVPYYL